MTHRNNDDYNRNNYSNEERSERLTSGLQGRSHEGHNGTFGERCSR